MQRVAAVRWVIGWVLVAGTARGDEPIEPGTISGRVVDAEGKGVAGAKVGTQFTYIGVNGTRTTFEVRTDGEGKFQTGPLDPVCRRLVLVIDADGYARASTSSQPLSVCPGRDGDVGRSSLTGVGS